VLIDLVESVESQVEQLYWHGRAKQVKALAEGGVQTALELLRWIESQDGSSEHVTIVETTLAKMFVYAGRPAEAEPILNKHMSADPQNGELIRLQALACEQLAGSSKPDNVTELRQRAAGLWAQLLADASLRQSAPKHYWEALERWLTLRLQAGHANQVAKRIQQEQIWYPALGGPPFKQRILTLLQQANRRLESSPQPADTQPAGATP
jgi:predicted Zn-dependent protease